MTPASCQSLDLRRFIAYTRSLPTQPPWPPAPLSPPGPLPPAEQHPRNKRSKRRILGRAPQASSGELPNGLDHCRRALP